MKIKINDIERECQILEAPPGTFADYNETFGFPQFILIAPAIAGECSFGDVVVCPIDCNNRGYECASPTSINNELNIRQFERFLENYAENLYDTESEAADYIINSMKAHGVIISPFVMEKYIEVKGGNYAKTSN